MAHPEKGNRAAEGSTILTAMVEAMHTVGFRYFGVCALHSGTQKTSARRLTYATLCRIGGHRRSECRRERCQRYRGGPAEQKKSWSCRGRTSNVVHKKLDTADRFSPSKPVISVPRHHDISSSSLARRPQRSIYPFKLNYTLFSIIFQKNLVVHGQMRHTKGEKKGGSTCYLAVLCKAFRFREILFLFQRDLTSFDVHLMNGPELEAQMHLCLHIMR
jgi:hypothetical protein